MFATSLLSGGPLGLGDNPEDELYLIMEKWRPYKLAETEEELAVTARVMEEAASFMLYNAAWIGRGYNGVIEALTFPFIAKVYRLGKLNGITGADFVSQLYDFYLEFPGVDLEQEIIIDLYLKHFADQLKVREQTFSVKLELDLKQGFISQEQAALQLKKAMELADHHGLRVVGSEWGWE